MDKGFAGFVKENWSLYAAQGNAITVVKEKLKRLKGDLKLWNRDVFGNIEMAKKSILQELEALDCQDCSGSLLESERLQRLGLVKRLKEIDKKIGIPLMPKS